MLRESVLPMCVVAVFCVPACVCICGSCVSSEEVSSVHVVGEWSLLCVCVPRGGIVGVCGRGW